MLSLKNDMPPQDKKKFKTLSLDKSRSPNFDLFSDQEEYLEEEVSNIMEKTMEQYMSQTRADYGSGIATPKIEDKDNLELKGQFLKELCDNTFSGLDHEDANEHIEKVLEIMDLFHILNITIDQVMLRAFLMSLTGAASHWLRNKPSGLITTWEDLKTKKEKDPGSFTLPCFINNVCFDNALADFGASVSVMPLSTYLNLRLDELVHTKLTVELAVRIVKYLKEIVENMLVDFKVLEDMDAYHDEGMDDVIFGQPFFREVGINAKRFEGMITIHNGNKEYTYQMAQLHPRRIAFSGYGVLDLVSFVVFGECWHGYAVSSLMDMVYWSSEQ
uniref:Reverse transcriptase domain-containing protein n=1 Tax=Tanacetum cinerariifolium TaxID=118510 RepID=A0A6L2LQX0_TANCI|nr:hypothetical protein [Tanacetum cinerariifolium]